MLVRNPDKLVPEHATRTISRIDRFEARGQRRVDNESLSKWRKTLDSVGKSFHMSRMSEFPKILPQPDCSAMSPALLFRMRMIGSTWAVSIIWQHDVPQSERSLLSNA